MQSHAEERGGRAHQGREQHGGREGGREGEGRERGGRGEGRKGEGGSALSVIEQALLCGVRHSCSMLDEMFEIKRILLQNKTTHS